MFLKNFKKYNYNSFIFGSSRAMAYNPEFWKKYLNKEDSPFLFDAAGESIYGIYIKLKFLDSLNVRMDNIIIALCRDGMYENTENSSDHLYIKHPTTSGESKLKFHYVFLKTYFNTSFLLSYYPYILTGQFKPYMTYLEKGKIKFNSITNGVTLDKFESELSLNRDQYYSKRKELFYIREGEQTDTIIEINEKNLFMLRKIKSILERNSTSYKVVLNPIYDETRFTSYDMNILKELFGNNLYDFTGKNFITENDTNWYEIYHFRPFIGDSIIKIINTR
jgi:hypothetical protein